MKRILACSLLFLAGYAQGQTPDNARPDMYSGRNFLWHCAQMEKLNGMPKGAVLDPDSMLQVGVCMGYIKGLVNGLELSGKAHGLHAAAICSPSDASVVKFVRIAIASLQANPAALDGPVAPFLIKSFRTYYPCGKQRSNP